MLVWFWPYQKCITTRGKTTSRETETGTETGTTKRPIPTKGHGRTSTPTTASTTASSTTRATAVSTKSVELMGPWYIIGALLLLSARAGDSTNHIIIPQQIGSGSMLNTHAASGGGIHMHHMAKTSISTTANKGTVLSGNGVIVAGGSIGPSSSLNTIVEEPEFTEYIENVTVPAGRNIKLACSVKNLGSYKVAWMHFEQSAILTVHNHVITRNPRISVTHDKHDRHRTWYLHINNVQEEDKGRYMCQINTVTAKTQFGYLNVVVPPNIDDSLSSSDVIVREGSNISLRCRASGSPKPVIKWKRDDNSRITITKNHIVNEWEGDTLEITRISRLDMGAYLCIASNGVPPTVSKRIKVSVDFPPMLLIPHQLVGAPEGFNVTIECFTEAHPTSLNYWTRGEGPIIHDSSKYKVEASVGVPVYKTHMKLTILSVGSGDDGIYKCVAKNPRGETDGIIRLYVSYPPTTAPTGNFLTDATRWDGTYGSDSSSRMNHGNDKNKTAGHNDVYGLPGQGEELSSSAAAATAALGDALRKRLQSWALLLVLFIYLRRIEII